MKKFTIEDFEEGLMLAGLVTPSTTKDLEAIEKLKQFDNEKTDLQNRKKNRSKKN